MSAPQQSPRVVIAARDQLIQDLKRVAGERVTQPNREQIADWMISSGYLSETYYAAVAAEIGEPT